MYTENDLTSLVKELLNILNKPGAGKVSGSKPLAPGGLTPAQGLVIAGLVLNLFEVTSVLVNKDKVVQIVLSGSLDPGVSPTGDVIAE